MGVHQKDGSGSSAPVTADPEVQRLRAERDALKKELEGARAEKRSRFRKIMAGFLIVLACLSFPIAITAGWTKRTLLWTDNWVSTVSPIVDHASVTDAMSRRLTEEVLILVNAPELVQEALPPRAAVLAGPITNSVSDFVEEQVAALLASDQFRTFWINANRFAHTQLVAVLRGDGDAVTTDDGKVVLNLVPVINEVLVRVEARSQDLLGKDIDLPEMTGGEVPGEARAKLEGALGVTVPEDLGEIVIYESDKLGAVQDAVRIFDRGVVALGVLAILLVIGGLWASTNRRRALIQMCTGILVVFVLFRRSAMYVQDQAVDLARPENRTAARAIVEDLLRGYFSLTFAIMIVLLLLVVGALVTGPYKWAVTLRNGVRRYSSLLAERSKEGVASDGLTEKVQAHKDAFQLGGLLFGVLLLLIFDVSWPVFFTIAALVGLYELGIMRIANRTPA